MSDFETVCIAMRDDLVGAIPKLSEASQHLFLPWDPENLTAGVGERHLAIWPSAEEAETAEPLATAPGAFRRSPRRIPLPRRPGELARQRRPLR